MSNYKLELTRNELLTIKEAIKTYSEDLPKLISKYQDLDPVPETVELFNQDLLILKSLLSRIESTLSGKTR